MFLFLRDCEYCKSANLFAYEFTFQMGKRKAWNSEDNTRSKHLSIARIQDVYLIENKEIFYVIFVNINP